MAVNSNLSCPMYVSFYLVLFREQKACYNICGNIGFLQADVHTQGRNTMRKRMQRAAVLVMVFCLLIMGSRVGADAKVIRAKASGKAVNENSQMIIDYSNISKG